MQSFVIQQALIQSGSTMEAPCSLVSGLCHVNKGPFEGAVAPNNRSVSATPESSDPTDRGVAACCG